MTNLRKYIVFLLISLLFVSCNKTLSVAEATSDNYSVDKSVPISPVLDSIIRPYRDSMKQTMDEILNYAQVDLEVGVPEGLLGNFIADLTYQTAKKASKSTPDFSILNNGGLRTSIPKGPITRGKIFELMPFENEIVIVELTGDKMLELIDYVRKKSLEAPSRKAGVPVGNFRMMMSNGEVNTVFINNKQFNPKQNYRVVTTDYLSNGGDHMDFFLNPVSVEKTGIKLRDAIIDYLIDLKNRNAEVNLALDGRIYNAE